MKTFVYSIHGFDKMPLIKSAAGKHELYFSENALSLETVHLAAGCDAIALFSTDNASSDVLLQLSKIGIKYIALRSVGYDHVDLEKANVLGLKVANVPAYSPNSIAEHSVALLMALNRKLFLSQKLMDEGDYRLDQLTGFDLYQKTIGIIGTGKIGEAFAKIMHGFGCSLLAYDIQENETLKKQTKIKYVSLDELCKRSDVISIHCPLTKKTKYMFDKSRFASMKKGVVFLNTARGAIVNTVDLIEAMNNGTVAMAGLDVYEYEKPIFFKDHRRKRIDDDLFIKLKNTPNVLITAHQAFLTNEALQGISDTTVENLDAWESGNDSPNQIK